MACAGNGAEGKKEPGVLQSEGRSKQSEHRLAHFAGFWVTSEETSDARRSIANVEVSLEPLAADVGASVARKRRKRHVVFEVALLRRNMFGRRK